MGKSAEAFRTISEAAVELDLPQHVLRFWETRFPQIKPLKRGGGRRYYRPDDVMLLKGIQHLLYDKGYTIKGVQRILKEEGPRRVITIGQSGSNDADDGEASTDLAIKSSADKNISQNSASNISRKGKTRLTNVMRELLECKRLLDNAREG
ncbi:Transcriptional regulator PA2737, MerR family [hydrothermal vent metagenome]|uniref:Transcriptional regulator PA2737, MerR family n=1 Tax=hydrothermal vent metagenome TaxID=652676 RepID=A0A3B0UWQ6_9ZZZZ